jgi:molecular chaperone DnaK (HSP70)
MKAIGIDLGTTNSVAASSEKNPRDPRVLTSSFGENLTPSVVSVRRAKGDSGHNEILVGRAALNYAERAPENTILSIKRLIGRDFQDPDIEQAKKRFNYEVVAADGNNPLAFVRLNGKSYSPTEISAMILRKVKEDAERILGEEVTHAVITVPAYFNEGQRAATREAGVQAGLVVKKIIDEPTAAAIAFGVETTSGARHRILVFDLGGGTFDISILHMVKDNNGNDQFQVLAIEGNRWLGGDDFDACIVDKIVDRVRAEVGEDPTQDPRFLFLAKQHSEAAKRQLSYATATEIIIPAAYRSKQGTFIDVELTLARSEFETMIQKYVDQSMDLVRKALESQNLKPEDVSDVLLVGGGTLTPLVYQTVENLFGAGKVRRNINPMECVARGAAILAATLHAVECPACRELNDESASECKKCRNNLASARAVGETGIEEVTAMSLGIAAVKANQPDVFVPIIPKGTPYPLRHPMKRAFQATSERLIRVPVYEGDKPVASQNDEQGIIEFNLPDDIDLNSRVEVSFNYDRNRALTVMISVPGTKLLKTETLRHDRPRTKASQEKANVENEEDWREDLESTTEFARRFLDQYKQYMEPNDQIKLRGDIERAEKLLVYPDKVEATKITRLLQMHSFNSGLATQLFLADRATNGVAPDRAQQINEAAKAVRQSFNEGDRNRVAEQARLLKVLVAKALESQHGVSEIHDREDYRGLLKMLE